MIKKIALIGVIVLVVGFAGSYVGLRIWFKSDIDKICGNAMSVYPGDKIEALLAVLNSGNSNLKDKNQVIWALGKLRDKRAVPVLEKYYTGQKCDHKKFVCQQGLQRSISVLKGERIDFFTFE